MHELDSLNFLPKQIYHEHRHSGRLPQNLVQQAEQFLPEGWATNLSELIVRLSRLTANLRRAWQCKIKSCAFAFFRRHPDFAAVPLDNTFGNG